MFISDKDFKKPTTNKNATRTDKSNTRLSTHSVLPNVPSNVNASSNDNIVLKAKAEREQRALLREQISHIIKIQSWYRSKSVQLHLVRDIKSNISKKLKDVENLSNILKQKGMTATFCPPTNITNQLLKDFIFILPNMKTKSDIDQFILFCNLMLNPSLKNTDATKNILCAEIFNDVNITVDLIPSDNNIIKNTIFSPINRSKRIITQIVSLLFHSLTCLTGNSSSSSFIYKRESIDIFPIIQCLQYLLGSHVSSLKQATTNMSTSSVISVEAYYIAIQSILLQPLVYHKFLQIYFFNNVKKSVKSSISASSPIDSKQHGMSLSSCNFQPLNIFQLFNLLISHVSAYLIKITPSEDENQRITQHSFEKQILKNTNASKIVSTSSAVATNMSQETCGVHIIESIIHLSMHIVECQYITESNDKNTNLNKSNSIRSSSSLHTNNSKNISSSNYTLVLTYFIQEILFSPMFTYLLTKPTLQLLANWHHLYSAFDSLQRKLINNSLILPSASWIQPSIVFQSSQWLLGNIISFGAYLNIHVLSLKNMSDKTYTNTKINTTKNNINISDDDLELYLNLCLNLIIQFPIPGVLQGKNGVVWNIDAQTLSASAIPSALQYQILSMYNHAYMLHLYERIFLPIRYELTDFILDKDHNNVNEALKVNTIKMINQSMEQEQLTQSSLSKWAYRLIKSAGHAIGMNTVTVNSSSSSSSATKNKKDNTTTNTNSSYMQLSSDESLSVNINDNDNDDDSDIHNDLIDDISLKHINLKSLPEAHFPINNNLIISCCNLWSLLFSQAIVAPLYSVPWRALSTLTFSTHVLDRVWLAIVTVNMNKKTEGRLGVSSNYVAEWISMLTGSNSNSSSNSNQNLITSTNTSDVTHSQMNLAANNNSSSITSSIFSFFTSPFTSSNTSTRSRNRTISSGSSSNAMFVTASATTATGISAVETRMPVGITSSTNYNNNSSSHNKNISNDQFNHSNKPSDTSLSTSSITTIDNQNMLETFAYNFQPNSQSLPSGFYSALIVLSCTLRMYLVAIDDSELYIDSKPLPLDQLLRIIRILKLIVFRIIQSDPSLVSSNSNNIMSTNTHKNDGNTEQREINDKNEYYIFQQYRITSLKTVLAVLTELYTKWSRKPFSSEDIWEIDLIANSSIFNNEIRQRTSFGTAILKYIPWSIKFHDRLQLFRSILDHEKLTIQGANPSELMNFIQLYQYQSLQQQYPRSKGTVVQVRRSRLIEDGIKSFDKVGNSIKDRIVVRYINDFGEEEKGIDSGGLFKDFLTDLSGRIFDPSYGLFKLTSDNTLYPNPAAVKLYGEYEAEKTFHFLGRVLGKAIFENITIQPQFAHFFLAFMHGRYNYMNLINDLSSLDAELYKNLMFLKTYEGDIKDLCLTFSVTDNEISLGVHQEMELIPGGSKISVTTQNRHRYINAVAKYYLFDRLKLCANAFFLGLRQVVSSDYLGFFCAPELQIIISGTNRGISLDDMKAHTHYQGGYTSIDRHMQRFWKIMADEFTEAERSALLKFVTSCERPPSLGFIALQPPFTIQRVECSDDSRLPTASTCFNILKLPTYSSQSVLKEKLLLSIQSGAGFDLS